ncbi:MAG: hypothetical protein ACSHXZ_10745 [Gammaproteobacteria bacterium]
MQSGEELMTSCFFVADVSCYEVMKDFSTPIVAIVVAIFTVMYAFRQLGTQHTNTLAAQKEESKRNTRIELFKDIGSISDSSSSLIRDISTYCVVKKYSNVGAGAVINQQEYEEIFRKFGEALLALVSKVESHEIVNIKLFRAFRFSLQSIHHDFMSLRSVQDRALVLDELLQLTSDAQMYIGDFQVCMQNMAYGEIFSSSVPFREPADKRIKVITNDENNLDELINYFWTESNWGKSCAKYQAEAEEKYSS